MNNFCIFRNVNDCKCCFFKTRNKYCSLHINNKNIIYEIVNEAIGIKQIRTSSDIYEIFKYIYNNPNIYVKEFIFKKILKTLFIKQWSLRSKFYYLNTTYLINYQNYDLLIDKIYKLNLNTYKIDMKYENRNYLSILKRFMKYVLIQPHIFKQNLTYINETDPFTFDNINEIPLNERFIYNEDNNYYCFKAIEFKYFIRTNGNWNPYTKKTIIPKIIINLDNFINYFKLNRVYNNNQWKTLEQAFTDVSQVIEKIGFYTNTQWFIKLNTKQIRNIIRLFKIISIRNNNNNNFNEFFNDMIININETEDNHQIYYYFAKEIIRLFEDGNSNFLLCCNFMKAIGVYSNEFYNSLPEWLSDIESPVIINNNNISRDLVYLINIIEN